MADIVSEIIGMATPTVVNALAKNSGISGTAVSGVLSGAVPGILGALVNRGSTPSGASAILAQLANVNPSTLTGLASSLGGAGAGNLATQGSSMLTALLGHQGVTSLTNAVASNAGVAPAAGGSLMGIASTLVMGALAKKSAGLDGAGLSQLLFSQKSAIEQALPAGLGQVLGMAGGLAGAGTAAMASASSVASSATSSVRNAASQAQASMPDAPSGGMGWLKFAIPAALIAAGVWYFAGHRNDVDDKKAATPAVTNVAPAPAAPAATPANIMIDNVDVTKNLTTAFSGLTSTLTSVTDVASATAALPKLTEAGTAISAVSGLASKFTPDQKTAVASMVTSAMPGLTSLATKVQGNADVVAVLKPALDGILANLGNLAK